MRHAIALFGLFAVALCEICVAGDSDAQLSASQARDAGFEALLENHGVATIGAGVIEDGRLVWTGYYGEQAPGVAADSKTLFNVASVTKTVAAELIVRLAADGELSLDEPMSPYWVDPDLADDPRHKQLTPRLALSHATGFPNWRYTDPEFKLRFLADPGTQYCYSGEGLEYVARFAEQKTGQSFNDLVSAHVLEPLDMTNTTLSPAEWVLPRIALPVDDSGQRHRPFCNGPDGAYCSDTGEWSAADEMATTVEDYARFLIAVMNADDIGAALHAERLTVRTSTADDEVLACALEEPEQCPNAQGYGLGWEIFRFNDATIISHGGSDWSERSMVYFDPKTRDGVILFLNAPASSSVEALIEGLDILDEGSRMARMYRGWVDAYVARQEAGMDEGS